MTETQNVYEVAFMKVAEKILASALTVEVMAKAIEALVTSIKTVIDEGDYAQTETIGPILNYADLAALGPNWFNDDQAFNEVAVLILGMMVGDVMKDFIYPSEIGLYNVHRLIDSVDADFQQAKRIAAASLAAKHGNDKPSQSFKHSNLQGKLLDLLGDIVGELSERQGADSDTDGESVVTQLADALESFVEDLETKCEDGGNLKSTPSAKTLH